MPTAALLHEAKLGEALLLTLFLHLSLTKLFALAMFPQFQPSHWFVSYNFFGVEAGICAKIICHE